MNTSGELDRGVVGGPGDDLEAQLAAGERALKEEGDLGAARKWFDTAYQEAERRDDPVAMARAVLGLGGLWAHEQRTAAAAATLRARQLDALRRLDPRSSLALRLRIRLAGEEDYRTDEHTGILALVGEARRADDAVALAEALTIAHHCVMGPEHGALRLELARELIGTASRTGRRGDLLVGLLWHTVDLFLAGDPHAERCLNELRTLLEQGGHLVVEFVVSAIDAMLAIRAGRFEEAQLLASVCAERGAKAGDVNAEGWLAGQFGVIWMFLGRAGELVKPLSELVNSSVMSVVDNASLAGLAFAAATAGDERLALSTLARLRGRDLADQPHSASWLLTICCAAETAYLVGDAETASSAHTLLAPYAHLPAATSLAVACVGSVRHALGAAALTVGDTDQAIRHLRQAVQDNLALGHWPALALSRHRLGHALARRDGAADPDARHELDLARSEADRLGMRLPGEAADAGPEPAEQERVLPLTCRREGRCWRIERGPRSVLVEDRVGMRHLAVLLGNPGCEVPATDLAGGPGSAPAGEGPDQPVLDEHAKREFKARLARLQTEIDELESAGRDRSATAKRTERDWLITELAAAAGMAGRTRRFTTGDERARIAVGKAIRRAVDQIAALDPVIGADLRATVQTGRHCSYRPVAS